jgi:hypothetical protein
MGHMNFEICLIAQLIPYAGNRRNKDEVTDKLIQEKES